MSLFFFHLVIGSVRIPDPVGVDLCRKDAMRLVCLAADHVSRREDVMAEIRKDNLVAIDICDASGTVSLLVPIRDAVVPDRDAGSPLYW